MADLETRVTGWSDDLIELDGAIYEEFDTYDAQSRLTFDNGAVLLINYTSEGIWRIVNVAPRPDLVAITRCEDREGWTGDSDGPIYSDEAVVTGAAGVEVEKVRHA